MTEIKRLVLLYLMFEKIDPRDTKQVLEHAPKIWKMLCESGKLPRTVTYEMLIDAIAKGAK